MQAGCGFGWNSQAALAHSRERSDGASTSAWSLSRKTAIVEPGAGKTGVTLAWSLGTQREPGGSMKHETSFLALVATREWAEGWLTHVHCWITSAPLGTVNVKVSAGRLGFAAT